MTAPPPAPAAHAASSGGLSGLRRRVAGWVRGHRAQAAAGAAAAGVAGLAIYKHRQAAAAGGLADDANATDTTGAPAVAGLSGSPDTSGTDFANAYQDQINALSDKLDQALQNPKAPSPPQPKPVPKPGDIRYTIKSGDTWAKIAKQVYGSDAWWATYKLRVANPALMSFGPNDGLGHFAGRLIKVPKTYVKPSKTPPKPKPKKPKPKKKKGKK